MKKVLALQKLQASKTKTASLLSVYSEQDRRAWRKDGTGYLQRSCTVTVYDYGLNENKKRTCCINGCDAQQADAIEKFAPIECSDLSGLMNSLPEGFFDEKCTWDRRVRWIDVEGSNGEVVEYCLSLVGSQSQTTFNMVVDPAQSSMALDIDSDTGNSVLVSALKSKLTEEASSLLHDETDTPLYSLSDMMEDETVSYLCNISEDRRFSLLISFQGDMEDDIFESVREEIRSKSSLFCTQDAGYLLMRLLRSSCDSLWGVLNYIDCALQQLETDAQNDTGNKDFFDYSRLFESECRELIDKFTPLESALMELSADFTHLVGQGPSQRAWRALAVQNRGMLARLHGRKQQASNVSQVYKDYLDQRANEAQAQSEKSQRVMGLILAVFSPMAFVSGVYGMNFTKGDGNTAIPELSMGYQLVDASDPSKGVEKIGISGYEYFWILNCVIIIVVLAGYVALGMIPNPFNMLLDSMGLCMGIQQQGRQTARETRVTRVASKARE
jgi:Mg2+ and Co2+ transporter CorA